MATAPSPPILIWQPGGGTPGGPVSNPPVYSQSDVTPLVQGQAYVDVVFGSIQTTADWVLVTCEVENTTDLAPLNIWPGIITSRTAAGFRLYLNGLPDTGNYYLHWAVSGVNVAPSPASTYYLTAVGTTFTVRLPPSTTISGPVTITPSDGGAGGSFNVDSVVLTTSSASATFTYYPASYGAITISTTNSSTLIDPAGVVLTIVVPTYTLTGPSSGNIGVASSNFTVTLIGSVAGTLHVTPNDAGVGTAGTFTPSSVALTTGSPSATFTYTPASGGAKTISATNDGGLSNPANLTYTAYSTSYTLSGPGSGNTGVASTNFTVALPAGGAVSGTVTVTPSSGGGGGTFTPTTVNLTTGAPSVTFTYTPASSGTKTISVTNSGTLTNPTSLSYVVTNLFDPLSIAGCKMWLKADAGTSLSLRDLITGDIVTPQLADGDPVTLWQDQSGNANNVGSSGSVRPLYRATGGPSGKPTIEFDGIDDGLLTTNPMPAGALVQPTTYFVVFNNSGRPVTGVGQQIFMGPDITLFAGGSYPSQTLTTPASGTWSVVSAIFNGASSTLYRNGTAAAGNPGNLSTNGQAQLIINADGGGSYAGKVSEILVYNSALGTTDRQNVENYLLGKYGL